MNNLEQDAESALGGGGGGGNNNMGQDAMKDLSGGGGGGNQQQGGSSGIDKEVNSGEFLFVRRDGAVRNWIGWANGWFDWYM